VEFKDYLNDICKRFTERKKPEPVKITPEESVRRDKANKSLCREFTQTKYWKEVEEPYILRSLEVKIGDLIRTGDKMSEVEFKIAIAVIKEKLSYLSFLDVMTAVDAEPKPQGKRYPYKRYDSIRR